MPQGFRINMEGPTCTQQTGGQLARYYMLRCVFLLQECMNPCCNATTCTLTGDAVCAHGQCCDDCKVRCCVAALPSCFPLIVMNPYFLCCTKL